MPLFVNATAGSTVYGAFDPISEIADICEKYNLWLHVDVRSCNILAVTGWVLCPRLYPSVTVLVCVPRERGVVDCSCPGSIATSLTESRGE